MIDSTLYQNKTVAYFTLGCKLNFAETSSLGRKLNEYGFRTSQPGEKADLCIINTCSVTELADKKSKQTIRKIVRTHPQAFIVVTGCFAQLKADEAGAIEGVDMVLGADQKMRLTEYLDTLNKENCGARIITTESRTIRTFSPSCSKGNRTRYFLKVQDGCDYFCSYCTIPMARGRSRNGAISDLVQQAKDVAEQGGKEIVLTGVNIGDFGKTTGESFFDLINALDQVEGIERYRISSIEPNLLTDEIIHFVAHSKRFMPHFHIPLQSGSDRVLTLMKRRYDTKLFAKKIQLIKQTMPDAFIGVDVIVGVRGEELENFQQAYNFIESLPISQLHVFTYSERPGTKALEIELNVPITERHRRTALLMELSAKKMRQFAEPFLGSERKVLFEQPSMKSKTMHGFTDNYLRVEVPLNNDWINQIKAVPLAKLSDDAELITTK